MANSKVLEQAANYRLPDIFRAAPICTRGDLGGSCSKPTWALQNMGAAAQPT